MQWTAWKSPAKGKQFKGYSANTHTRFWTRFSIWQGKYGVRTMKIAFGAKVAVKGMRKNPDICRDTAKLAVWRTCYVGKHALTIS